VITTEEARRLNVGMTLCPREAMFLGREMNRANMVPDNADLRRVVHMDSQVVYCDHKTGDVRDVLLVYPH
jgi:regulator of nucleoside diphosphate kinase